MLLVNKEFAKTLVIRKTNEELVVKMSFLRSKASPPHFKDTFPYVSSKYH